MNSKPGVLIIDDRVDNFKILKNILRELDCEVFWSESGEDALEKINQYDFAIALVDLYMPGLDGFQTIELIHENEKAKDLPAIIVTAQAPDPEIITQSIDSGAIDFISKPLIPAVIKGKVSIFLELYKKNRIIEESELLFRDFFEEAAIGFHIFDANGFIIDINQAELDIIGYSRDEIVGKKKWLDIIIPEDRKKINVHWEKIKTIGYVKDIEYTLIHKDGHHVDVLLNASARYDEKGNILNTRGSILDVSIQRRALLNLRESEENLNNFINSSPDSYLLLDSKLNVIDINSTALSLLDLPRNKVINKNIIDISPELQDSERYEDYLNVLETGKPITREYLINHPAFGEKKFILGIFKAGDGIGISASDITENLKIKKELIDLARYPQENPNPVLRIDVNKKILFSNEGGSVFKKLWCSDSCETVSGEVSNLITMVLKTGKQEEFEIISEGKTYLLLFSPIVEMNYVNVYGTNVTRLKNVEKELVELKNNLLKMVEERTDELALTVDKLELSNVDLIGSEKRYRTLFDSISDSIFIHNMGSSFVEVNNSACTLLGYSREEFLSMSPEDINYSIGKAEINEKLKKIEKEKSLIFEVDHVAKDGTVIPMEISSRIIEYNDEDMVLSVARNMTDRINSEEEYRRLSEMNFSLVQAIPDSMIQINREYIILSFIPDEKLKMIFENVDIVGKNIKDVMPKDVAPRFFDTLNRVLEIGKPITIDYPFTFKNEIFYFEARFVISGEENILILNKDITFQKRAEKALIESEDKLRTITASAPDSIVMIDNNGIVTFWNRAAEKLFGYTRGEVIGKDVHELLSPEIYMIDIVKGFEKFKTSGKGYILSKMREVTAKRKDGTEFDVELNVSALKINDTWNAIGIIRDISERKETERELREAKIKAEESNVTKSNFLANMSHEIRTPMNSILGFIDILKRTTLNEDQLKYVNYVANSSKGLLTIINDILDFSKLENGKLDIDNYSFNTFEEFESEIEIFENFITEKDVEIHAYIDPDLNCEVLGDSLRIRQVMNNLISNAIKFTPEKGHVLIDIIRKNISRDNIVVAFSVSDTGIGIEDRVLETVFESFKQADASITRKFGGTGLGLSISSNIVELMGGKLEVSSIPEQGSRFYFEIKLKLLPDGKGNIFFHHYKNKKIALYLNEKENLIQNLVFVRYLYYFSKDFELFTNQDDMSLKNFDVIFYLRDLNYEYKKLEELIKLNDSVPIVIVSNYIENKIDKVIHIIPPVTGSKIFKTLQSVFDDHIERGRSFKKSEDKNMKFEIRVLVAEDNPVNQELMKFMLQEMGAVVEIAENGKVAVEMFKKGGWDIVFMDINMPVLDGVSAAKEILDFENENNLNHVPVVALTARAIKGDREEFILAGMDNYISKPVYADKIIDILSAYTEDRAVSDISNELTDTAKSDENENENEYDIDLVSRSLGIDRELVIKIVNEFKKSSERHVSDLKMAYKENDLEKIYQAAHKFHGAALNLRFKKLSDLLKIIENNTKNKEKADYMKYIKLIEDEMKIIKGINYY